MRSSRFNHEEVIWLASHSLWLLPALIIAQLRGGRRCDDVGDQRHRCKRTRLPVALTEKLGMAIRLVHALSHGAMPDAGPLNNIITR